MAGSLKLDGNEFLVKEGGQFKITNSELKLKSSGNTVVDSSGNAVISESGGTVTLNKGTVGSAVSLASATFPAGHGMRPNMFCSLDGMCVTNVVTHISGSCTWQMLSRQLLPPSLLI